MLGLKGSGTDVIDNGVTKDVIFYLFFRYIFCFFSNNNSQFYLIIQIGYNVSMAFNAFTVCHRLVYTLGEVTA